MDNKTIFTFDSLEKKDGKKIYQIIVSFFLFVKLFDAYVYEIVCILEAGQ